MFSVLYTVALLHLFYSFEPVSGGPPFPSSLPQCRAGDTECLPGVMTKYIQTNTAGNPDLGLIPLDPLFLDKLSIVQSEQSPVNIQLNFRNITLSGIKSITVNKVVGFEKDPKKSKFEVIGTAPLVAIVGKYRINGKVLFLPIVGNGRANLTFENVNIHAKVIPKVETRKDGKEYVIIDKVKIRMTVSKFIPYFSNLFNDENLSKNMNVFLQENSEEIFKEVKSSIEKAVADVFKMVLTGVFDRFAYEDIWLPETA